jgi:protein CpxP
MGGPNGLLGPGILGPALDLTDAQKEQIKGVLKAHAEEWKGIGNRMMTARKALDEAVNSGEVNESLIRQRSSEAGAVEADAAVARARVRAEVLQLLTPEQQAKARELAARVPGPGRRGQQ